MTHTTSDESQGKTIDGFTEQKQSPSPRLSRQGWGLLLLSALLLAGGTWGILQLTRSAHSPKAALVPAMPAAGGAIAVETLTIRSQPIVNTLELSGSIRPVDQATLSTRVMGRITKLSLESGDRFREGEVLAQIDVTDMTAQTNQAKSGVVQAQSVVMQHQAELSRSQAMLNQFEAQKIETQAALQLATIDQRRMATLRADGAVSQEQLDRANTVLTQAKSKVAQINAGIRQAEAAISQSNAAIAQFRSAVKQAESGVTSADINESYGTIIAPFNGVVIQKLAYEGEMATPGTPLLKVENPDKLQLEIAVPEEKLCFVRVGQSVKVRFNAVNQTLNTTIQQIVPAADPKSRSFLVKIPLSNSGRLISGMFGRITLPLGEKQQTIFISADVLMQRGQLQGVYVVEKSGSQPIAVLRWVKVGKVQNRQVEIVAGLMSGDRIITNKINQLSDGQAINPQP
ncbi:efflux RND transporter periplasmic adaptor subunit [Nostoc sp. UHCC 0251]|uniref:efflux RND transporter periplasmic adaptor subunit n=1 Tax=Nostoc sp. UHCC 0251 TaxID=3110240 RepID=UPI002B20D31D|nr:efflux RND transporter periplasmic adaptor subunit [Nostoc sp. UHCC 0251]MEA5624295.1 efflux RND transporter periplasmic adaptor subunit [Nostoc sp. UHCC 0251]